MRKVRESLDAPPDLSRWLQVTASNARNWCAGEDPSDRTVTGHRY